MKTGIAISLAMSIILLSGANIALAAEIITFEPYTEEEEPFLTNGGTHDFDRMVADFGGGFNNNHFRFADMAAFWVYKFEFDAPATAIATMDLGAEFKVSIDVARAGQDPDYVVALEEENHTHAMENKEIRIIEYSDYFENPGNTVWIKFEDSIPQDGWGAYLDSFTLEYTLGQPVESAGKLITAWSRIKTGGSGAI